MAYEVLARKWRPQQFGAVIGQAHVTQTLTNAIESNRVAHAYILVGPRGTGKTTTARILAKALNCAKGPTATPCDACDSCKEIMAGNCLDVLEFDAASNTQVDRVRDIILDTVRFRPARDRHKIFIIDEVHMLSNASFNALLKTLEEPPAHVKFIFATTEAHKVPATILSRCQRFDLRRIGVREIVERLREIAAAEKWKIEDSALLAVARASEGGLRDAESALDQLVAFRGNQIAEQDVLGIFGLVSWHALLDLAAALLQGQVPAALRLMAEFSASGKDLQRLVLELLEHFRHVLVLSYLGEADAAALELPDNQLEALRAEVKMTSPEKLLRIVDLLAETENRLRYALSRRTLLETSLVRCARAATTTSIDEIIAELRALKDGLPEAAAAAPSAAPQPMAGASVEPPAAPQKPLDLPPAPLPPAENEVQLLSSAWHQIVDAVGRLAPLARGYLLDAKPIRVGPALVTIGFDPEFAENQAKINFERNIKAVRKVLSEQLGREVSVEFCVLDARSTLPGDIKLEDTEVVKPADHADAPPAVAATKKTITREEWMKNPLVVKTLELFSGELSDVRE